MDYVQVTDAERQQMLETIGVKAVDDLYSSLPQRFRLPRPLDLPRGRSELELVHSLQQTGQMNRPASAFGNSCFLGGGAYDHYIPTVVDTLAAKSEFVTAYTPYQAEASQGSLQAFFEFQTLVCRLAGLDVANASLYEGATATAEAVMLALNVTGKHRVLVAETLHPHYRQVLRTYLDELPVEFVELRAIDGRMQVDDAITALDEDTACLVVQSPNVFGLFENWTELFAAVHKTNKALAIAIFNPTACGAFKRPGDCGADLAASEGQPLGIPLQFGGPYLGLFAVRSPLMRKMPGRLVGQTTDRVGRRSFCLTLQTREQHIRGAKATSNICTNQGLAALRAAIYLSALGPQGLHEVALHCYHKAHHAAHKIAALDGFTLAYSGAFFHEFVVNCPAPAQAIIDLGRQRAIAPGLDCSALGIGESDQLLIAVTEKRTAQEIAGLIELLQEFI